MNSAAGLALLGGLGTLLILFLRAAVSAAARWQERSAEAETQRTETRKANDIENRVASDPAYRQRVRDFFEGGA